jgi:hypothetical protein
VTFWSHVNVLTPLGAAVARAGPRRAISTT